MAAPRMRFPQVAVQYNVSYEHSLSEAPDDFVARVPSQIITDVPANVPPVLLPEFLTNLIQQRSPRIGRIRNLRVI